MTVSRHLPANLPEETRQKNKNTSMKTTDVSSEVRNRYLSNASQKFGFHFEYKFWFPPASAGLHFHPEDGADMTNRNVKLFPKHWALQHK
jgi:hypothetical protein